MPVMSVFWRMAAAKGSMKIVNKRGENEHPCLVPLYKVKLCEVSPLVVIVADGEVYDSLAQLMNESPKPNRSNVENRNFQLTLSNAFLASNVTMTVLLFFWLYSDT